MSKSKLADVIREGHGKLGPFDKFEYAAEWVDLHFVVIDRADLPAHLARALDIENVDIPQAKIDGLVRRLLEAGWSKP